MPERTDHNEAMRLADRISPETDWYEFDQVTWCNEAAALLRQLSAERDQLRAEVDRLRADAERYRWLKAYDQNSEDMGICKWVDEGWSGQWVIEHDPDAAIDHARNTHKDTP